MNTPTLRWKTPCVKCGCMVPQEAVVWLLQAPYCAKCAEKMEKDQDIPGVWILAEAPFRTAALAIATERVDLLCRKQSDYGPANISSMGYAGLLVRMNDKMERLKHLMLSDKEPDNEAIDDTLDDISNYALIWQMGKRGLWPVPFEPIVLRRVEPCAASP